MRTRTTTARTTTAARTVRGPVGSRRRRVAAALVALPAVVATLAGIVTPAHAAGAQTATVTVQGRSSGYGLGYNLTLDGRTRAAAYRLMAIGGKDIPVYCVQLNVDYNESADTVFTGTARTAAAVPNAARVADLVTRSSSIGTTFLGRGSTADEQLMYRKFEASAIQLAIWKLTDNLDLAQVTNNEIRNRATELAAGAAAGADTAVDLAVSADYSGSRGARRVTVTVTAGSSPLPGATVTVTGTVSGTLTTGADGTASLALGDDAASVNVATSRVVPAGVILAPGSGQKVVTAAAVTLDTSAVLAVPAAEAATTTSATVATTPVTRPSAPPTTTVSRPVTPTATTGPDTTSTTVEPTTTLPSDDPVAGVIRGSNSSGRGRWTVALLVLLVIAVLVFAAVRLFGGNDETGPYPPR